MIFFHESSFIKRDHHCGASIIKHQLFQCAIALKVKFNCLLPKCFCFSFKKNLPQKMLTYRSINKCHERTLDLWVCKNRPLLRNILGSTGVLVCVCQYFFGRGEESCFLPPHIREWEGEGGGLNKGGGGGLSK